MAELPMSDGLTMPVQHQAAGPYTLRMPDRARTVIPPLNLRQDGQTQVWAAQLGRIANTTSNLDLDFLNSEGLNESLMLSVAAATDWDYIHRRQAQAVLPFMYIGPLAILKDQDFLTREAITMVVAVHPDSKLNRLSADGSVRVPRSLGLEVAQYFATTSLQLVKIFDTVNTAVDSHLFAKHNHQQTGKVLFCCESGNVQSSAALVAWLVAHFTGLTTIEAIQLVAAKRMSCGFDEALKHAISDWAVLLQAKKDVRTAGMTEPHPLAPPGQSATKRSRGVDDEDEDMLEADDVSRFTGRASTPFLSTG